ncbi:MAG: GntR family transcriptional regulator [Rhodospirillales bacterium]
MPGSLSAPPSETSLADRAYYSIRTLILKGTYGLGSTLVRRDLAEQLGMSIVPIAEALARLEAEGLVVNRPRVGTIVPVPTPAQIRGQWLVREALESQAARLFARRASAEERNKFWRKAEEFDLEDESLGAQAETDPETMFRHRWRHMEVHLQIAESASAVELRKAIEQTHLKLFYWMHNRSLYDRPAPSRWHRNLAEVLCSGAEEEADAAMRAHVNDRLEELMRNLEKFLTINVQRMNGALGRQESRS